MTAIVDPRTGALRLACEVPHCTRTRGQRKGERPIAQDERWICGEHWRLVPRGMKAILRRARRKAAGGYRSWQAVHRIWGRCRREAIEIAVGIKS